MFKTFMFSETLVTNKSDIKCNVFASNSKSKILV